MTSYSGYALNYVGTRQFSGKHRQIVDGYNHIVPLPRGYRVRYTDAWCGTFVSYVLKQCGCTKNVYECSANRMRQMCKPYQVKDGQTDDLIFYDWNKDSVSDHVGIICSVSKDGIYKVVEGNKSHGVGIRYIKKNSGNIQMIARVGDTTVEPKKKPGRKKSVKTVAKEVIAGKWGNGAERVKKLKDAGYNPVDVQKEVNKMV